MLSIGNGCDWINLPGKELSVVDYRGLGSEVRVNIGCDILLESLE